MKISDVDLKTLRRNNLNSAFISRFEIKGVNGDVCLFYVCPKFHYCISYDETTGEYRSVFEVNCFSETIEVVLTIDLEEEEIFVLDNSNKKGSPRYVSEISIGFDNSNDQIVILPKQHLFDGRAVFDDPVMGYRYFVVAIRVRVGV